jgi:hypothetical protein
VIQSNLGGPLISGAMTMLARLGNVLYWLGCILAALIITAAIVEWFGEAQYRSNGWAIVFEFAVFAFVVWVIGRMCRYVLSGT